MFSVMCNMEICKDWTKPSSKAHLIGRNAVIQIELVVLKKFQRYTYLGFYNFFYLCISMGIILDCEKLYHFPYSRNPALSDSHSSTEL